MRLVTGLVLALLLCLCAPAQAAFNSYKTATINCATNVGQCGTTGNSTAWPVLIRIVDADFATYAQADGYDIRPYDTDQTTALTFQLVLYDNATGTIEMWVLIPTLVYNADRVLYFYFGDTGRTDATSNTTWNTAFLGVYHFPNGTTISHVDSSQSARNAAGVATPTAAAGRIDGGLSLNSTTQYDTITSSTSPAAITLSAWIKMTSCVNYSGIVSHYDGSISGSVYQQFLSRSTCKIAMYVGASGNVSYDPGATTLSTGTWYLVTLVYNSTVGLIGYVNTTQDGTGAANGAIGTATATTWSIGVNLGTPVSGFWDGVIDEARISNVVRDINWITSDYHSQRAQTGTADFITWGSRVPIAATTVNSLPMIGVGR